jgi:hypothetical protein
MSPDGAIALFSSDRPSVAFDRHQGFAALRLIKGDRPHGVFEKGPEIAFAVVSVVNPHFVLLGSLRLMRPNSGQPTAPARAGT